MNWESGDEASAAGDNLQRSAIFEVMLQKQCILHTFQFN